MITESPTVHTASIFTDPDQQRNVSRISWQNQTGSERVGEFLDIVFPNIKKYFFGGGLLPFKRLFVFMA